MTPEQARQLLPVIKAYSEGATIEAREMDVGVWFQTSSPGWSMHYEYRIQPQKQTRWLNIYKDSKPAGFIESFMSKQQADAQGAMDRVACIRIEYTEGDGL